MLRAAWEEAKILDSRRPITEVVRDTATPAELRDKLRLVRTARTYAELRLGLDAGDAFTSYATVESDTLLLVVSAAPRFRLAAKTWWFPIVGRIPYRGYFDFERAREEARRLAEEGYDTYVRPTSAFSTLGWLPDPLLSTTVRADSVGLVQTVFHEITHSTYFPAGAASFNESFATFAGNAAAIEFFCEALARDAPCRRARARWHDTRLFGRFVRGLADRLERLYARSMPEARMATRKRQILEEEARRFEERLRPRFRTSSYARLDPAHLNNAWLLSLVLYYDRLDDFETIRRGQPNLRRALRSILRSAREADSPWEGLDRLLSQESGPPDTLGPLREDPGAS